MVERFSIRSAYEPENASERSERDLDQLDQSILAKAFRGELVPHDPADEPASVLLDRIRTARGGGSERRKATRARSPANPEPVPPDATRS